MRIKHDDVNHSSIDKPTRVHKPKRTHVRKYVWFTTLRLSTTKPPLSLTKIVFFFFCFFFLLSISWLCNVCADKNSQDLDVNDLWTKITYFLSITLTILKEKWAWVRLTSRPPGLFDCVLPRTNFIFMLTLHLGDFYKIVRASNWRLFLLKMMTSMAIQLKFDLFFRLRISLFGIFLVLKISKKKLGTYSLGLILILHGDRHSQGIR